MKCRETMRAVVGNAFSDEQLDEILARVSARAQKKGLGAPSNEQNAALRDAAKEMAADNLKEMLIRKRAETMAQISKIKREQFYGDNASQFHNRMKELLVGSSRLEAGAGLSIDARGRALADRWRGDLLRDINAIEGAFSRLYNPFKKVDREFEKEISKELSRLNGARIAQSEEPMATQIAQAFKKFQDIKIDFLNSQGAYINRLEGYITKQTHDALKIAGGFFASGKNDNKGHLENRSKWVDFISPLLDDKTFENVDENVLSSPAFEGFSIHNEAVQNAIKEARVQFLENIWTDIVTGRHDANNISDLDGFSVPAGIARKLSQDRSLHFKDAESWFQYNDKFGSGSILQNFLQDIDKSARQGALMEMFGPNPRAAFDADLLRLNEKMRDGGFVKQMDNLQSWDMKNLFAAIDGSLDAPHGLGELKTAHINKGFRIWQALSKLGGMAVSSISDMGAGATSLVRAGVPIFNAYSEYFKSLPKLRNGYDKKIADMINVVSRSMIGDIGANFSDNQGVVGGLEKWQQRFYKFNGFDMWQKAMRTANSVALAKMLGSISDKAFNKIDLPIQKQLMRFGIDQGLWDMLRGHADNLGFDEHGKVILPDMAQRMDKEKAVIWHNQPKSVDVEKVNEKRLALQAAFAKIGEPGQFETFKNMDDESRAILEKLGVNDKIWQDIRSAGLDNITDRTIAKYFKIDDIHTEKQKQDALDEAHLRVQAWFSSFIDDAMTEPRAAEKARLNFGTRQGTIIGEAIRHIMQFKSFSYTFATRNIEPTIGEFRSTYRDFKEGKVGEDAFMRPAMMAANTIVGATILGYVAGAAKDLLSGKEARPVDRPETWLAAFIQGGGAGFYGDFLTAQYNRYGSSPIAALSGPNVGNIEQILSIFGKLRDGVDAGASAMNLAVANTPFANVFYLRAALNYSILYNLQEAASPGYLDRMDERMREEQGRGLWFK